LFRRFADDENRRFVVAGQAIATQKATPGGTTACRPRRSPRAMPARSNQASWGACARIRSGAGCAPGPQIVAAYSVSA
jgi:hypothetical protein